MTTVSSASLAAACARPDGASTVRLPGRVTSLRLERVFMDGLAAIAAEKGISISALVAEIDLARRAGGNADNLSRVIRAYVTRHFIEAAQRLQQQAAGASTAEAASASEVAQNNSLADTTGVPDGQDGGRGGSLGEPPVTVQTSTAPPRKGPLWTPSMVMPAATIRRRRTTAVRAQSDAA
ncbi:ribbon-helix-helix domain-containing protein [Azospirillum sp. sgz302134]